MMRKSLFLSTGFHLAVVAVGYIGLPAIRKPPPVVDIPISIEVIEIAAKTELPAAPEKKEEKPEKPKKKPPPPPPAPEVKAPPPPPPPPPVAAAEPAPVVKPPEKPKAKPKPKPKPPEKAKPKPKPKAKPKPPSRLAKLRPRRKPKPPDPFASVLRTVEKIRGQPKPKTKKEKKAKKKKKPKPKTRFEEQIAKSLQTARATGDATRVTLSERDAMIQAIKRQLEPCWNLPAGAKDAKNMTIGISVEVDPNGKVRSARINDRGRMLSDPFFRASAESALRAVLNPKCSPFKLPADKYAIWRDLNINFNPRDMF